MNITFGKTCQIFCQIADAFRLFQVATPRRYFLKNNSPIFTPDSVFSPAPGPGSLALTLAACRRKKSHMMKSGSGFQQLARQGNEPMA